ncbi:hypothetical protein BS47DRAFT_1332507 [Hydnum rufescens UP504]|uniref:Uncharacterized protein n=1 Tax=Hydnum rufescens UP504 TaxID=1448309 RepID=A0A9P6ANR5_9AGAM|nr:hypothetical protein BS47DRAFT_1332507 [Hydnum rufescens UP504]
MSGVTPTTTSDIHPRLIEALSPPSHFYFTLWPLIIAKSPFLFRERTLRNVNHEFRKYADTLEHHRSIQAKRAYRSERLRKGVDLPVLTLEGLSFDSVIEWREWGADKAGFESVEAFREFCVMGDIDPDAMVRHDFYASRYASMSIRQDIISPARPMWSSRAKDILVFSWCNPLESEGNCHYFGIVGRADKLIPMFDFFLDKGWCDEMAWEREWI